MHITSFRSDDLDEAVALFVRAYQRQRLATPALPAEMEDPGRVKDRLEGLMSGCPGLAAWEGDRLAGYMGWFLIDHFRGTNRRAAYCPEWGHAAVDSGRQSLAVVYRALYRAASAYWFASGCETHALTLLASDQPAVQAWFWNGFGLTVVDAIRSMDRVAVRLSDALVFAKATRAEVEILAGLEAEHWQHYGRPPVFMTTGAPDGPAEFTDFLNRPGNSAWVAWCQAQPAGYMRFEASGYDTAAVVQAPTTIAITGAYTRPAFRGLGLAAGLLNHALADYAVRGYERCAVDFESFNPEAAAFWMKYFQPVCFSVVRVPELRFTGN